MSGCSFFVHIYKHMHVNNNVLPCFHFLRGELSKTAEALIWAKKKKFSMSLKTFSLARPRVLPTSPMVLPQALRSPCGRSTSCVLTPRDRLDPLEPSCWQGRCSEICIYENWKLERKLFVPRGSSLDIWWHNVTLDLELPRETTSWKGH